jgi:hypothetical protein
MMDQVDEDFVRHRISVEVDRMRVVLLHEFDARLQVLEWRISELARDVREKLISLQTPQPNAPATRLCPRCGGVGTEISSSSTSGRKSCEVCAGTGRI